jgi:hypothetical protein
MKISRRQVSIAYYGKCAQEWIAKWGAFAASRMVAEACEYSEVLSASDAILIMEVARGERVA